MAAKAVAAPGGASTAQLLSFPLTGLNTLQVLGDQERGPLLPWREQAGPPPPRSAVCWTADPVTSRATDPRRGGGGRGDARAALRRRGGPARRPIPARARRSQIQVLLAARSSLVTGPCWQPSRAKADRRA